MTSAFVSDLEESWQTAHTDSANPPMCIAEILIIKLQYNVKIMIYQPFRRHSISMVVSPCVQAAAGGAGTCAPAVCWSRSAGARQHGAAVPAVQVIICVQKRILEVPICAAADGCGLLTVKHTFVGAP
jgi:hypothetical protein